MNTEEMWLALMIGNSRLHWASFVGETLQEAWDTDHLSAEEVNPLMQGLATGELPSPIQNLKSIDAPAASRRVIQNPKSKIYLASVVPSQTALWQSYSAVHSITLDQVPLVGLYPTLGIDRALAVLGAAEVWGLPALVIDAGTALTFTGVDANRQLMGGAILPGLKLQLQSLAQKTAELPDVQLPQQLPCRWAMNTSAAIESGVIYTVLAGIQNFITDWQSQYPQSQVVLTGGDSTFLLTHLKTQFPDISAEVTADPHLIFWGILSLKVALCQAKSDKFSR